MHKEKLDFHPKSIVYATDFSVCSQNAGLYAALLAKYFSARLYVAHAFTLSQAAMEVEMDDALISQQRKDLKSLLAKKAATLAPEKGRAHPILLEGDPKTVIPNLADVQQPALIALGTHGGGRLERDIIGSVAEQILRSTPWPSLTVGPQVPFASSAEFPFRRILCVTDSTLPVRIPAVHVVGLAREFRASIDILNIVPESLIGHPERLADVLASVHESLKEIDPKMAKEISEVSPSVGSTHAHATILRYIREHSIDLLVLGVRKTVHVGLETSISGAFRLIAAAECPVLTITG